MINQKKMRVLLIIFVLFYFNILYAQKTNIITYSTDNRITYLHNSDSIFYSYSYDKIGNRISFEILNLVSSVDLEIVNSIVNINGFTLILNFNIQNNGLNPSMGVFTRFYISDTLVGIGDELYSIYTNYIPPDSFIQLETFIPLSTSLNPGIYYLSIFADSDSLIAETAETNNIAILPFTILPPSNYYKLELEDFSLSKQTCLAGDSLDLGAFIQNTGDITSANYSLTAYLSQNQSFEAYLDEELVNTSYAGGSLSSNSTNLYSANTIMDPYLLDGDYYVLLVLSLDTGGVSTVQDMVSSYLAIGQQAQLIQQRWLQPGWNYVSFNVSPQNKSVESVFAGISGELEEVKSSALSYVPVYNTVHSNMESILDGEGYLINVNQTSMLEVQGEPIDRSTIPILLSAGWNLVAFYGSEATSMETALQSVWSYLEKVEGQEGQYDINGSAWSNTLTQLQPGYSYFVKVSSDVQLIYNY
jgi:hypothetical protein